MKKKKKENMTLKIQTRPYSHNSYMSAIETATDLTQTFPILGLQSKKMQGKVHNNPNTISQETQCLVTK